MAHAQSNKALIWKIFIILTIVTLVEVILGIYKPASLFHVHFLGTSLLNSIFLILTIIKAYYIAWYFMHLKDEKKWFRRSIVWTLVVYIVYLTFFLLYDGIAVTENMNLLFD